MSTNYPGAVDSYTNPRPSDALSAASALHTSQHTNINDAMTAVQTTLGVDPQGGFGTVVLRFDATEAGTGANLSRITSLESATGDFVQDGANLGSGANVFSAKSGSNLQFKTVQAGSNIGITESGTEMTISANVTVSSISGENVGVGGGVFKTMNGTSTSQFKSLVAGSNIGITENTNDLTISANVAAGQGLPYSGATADLDMGSYDITAAGVSAQNLSAYQLWSRTDGTNLRLGQFSDGSSTALYDFVTVDSGSDNSLKIRGRRARADVTIERITGVNTPVSGSRFYHDSNDSWMAMYDGTGAVEKVRIVAEDSAGKGSHIAGSLSAGTVCATISAYSACAWFHSGSTSGNQILLLGKADGTHAEGMRVRSDNTAGTSRLIAEAYHYAGQWSFNRWGPSNLSTSGVFIEVGQSNSQISIWHGESTGGVQSVKISATGDSYLTTNEKLGIGTYSPKTQLHVTGSISAEQNVSANYMHTSSLSALGAVSAQAFYGDGSNLQGVQSSGSADSISGSVTSTQFTENITTLSDAANIETDVTNGNFFRVQIADNRTLSNPTGATADGMKVIWAVQQDGVGSRTLAFDSKFRFGTTITGYTASTTANTVDYITAIYNEPADSWDVVAISEGYVG